jgi:predicted nucleotide-binding protein
MEPLRKNLFFSYSRGDAAAVRLFATALERELATRRLPVNIWRDEEALQPGVSWRSAILDAIDHSIGILLFVSSASMQSSWVRTELQALARSTGRFIVPVILEHVLALPPDLSDLQWLDISADIGNPIALRAHAARLADVIASKLPSVSEKTPLSRVEAQELADSALQDIRESTATPTGSSGPPTSAFVVHGHDLSTRDLVCETLSALGVEPVVLSQSAGPFQSLLQKFFGASKRARFAVVILTADDYGASLIQYDEPNVGKKALQYRARQNVILELGFFYGQLGWENVFVLFRKAPKVFPNFERPSDLDGAVFDEVDDSERWKRTLAAKLKDAGFQIRTTASLP